MSDKLDPQNADQVLMLAAILLDGVKINVLHTRDKGREEMASLVTTALEISRDAIASVSSPTT